MDCVLNTGSHSQASLGSQANGSDAYALWSPRHAVGQESGASKGGKGKGFQKFVLGDFPGGAVVKNPPANAEDTGSIPGPGRSHMPRSN